MEQADNSKCTSTEESFHVKQKNQSVCKLASFIKSKKLTYGDIVEVVDHMPYPDKLFSSSEHNSTVESHADLKPNFRVSCRSNRSSGAIRLITIC